MGDPRLEFPRHFGQLGGYGYTWRRDLSAIQPEQSAHGADAAPGWLMSPLHDLIRRAEGGEHNPTPDGRGSV
jgi:hypothetical protein